MRNITLTVYMAVDENENTNKWNVAEWLNDPTVCGWDITDGHGDCQACKDACEHTNLDDCGRTCHCLECPDCGIVIENAGKED
jgi:hypothetical protein